MKKTVFLLFTLHLALLAELTIGQNMPAINMLDQFDKEHNLSNTTQKVIFTCQKASSHVVKDFLALQADDYLQQNHALYIADVSGMPSFISFFVLPMLTSNPYPILVIEEEDEALIYKDEKHLEEVMVVILKDQKVIDIVYLDNDKALKKAIEE